MKELAFRLKKGDDLKKSIEDRCKNINTGIILCGVGSLYHAYFRLAKAKGYFDKQEDYEIVSLIGTISNGKTHLHISLSDENGIVIGGHLENGCLINTTCEIVIGILEEYESIRNYDVNTDFGEIEFTRKDK